MHARTAVHATAVAAVSVGIVAVMAAPGHAGAEVVRPESCGWTVDESGESIEGTGIEQDIPGSFCQVVLTPTGEGHYVLRGEAPEDYDGDRAVVVGSITVVAPSGRIVETGSFGSE